jgi:hypothetical protein
MDFLLNFRNTNVIRNCFPSPIEHSAKPKQTHSESRQSRLAIPSQNKKRGKANAQTQLNLPHILFCPTPHQHSAPQ